ncbi:hypothetical protein POV27_01460 [Aureisphaera galaxeae]|uniref:hypothetical protein n=1 Tax=Aureisphaera galaxeae TaxID=1538023 RepID=UPI002350C534|nr:hypothetical protein [Aureisphaera galaxeae]MDC8002706.1 hypothetical protein [Aureisphaera galaxeae]
MNPDIFLEHIQQLPDKLAPEDVGSHVLAPLFSHIIAEPLKYEQAFAPLRDKLLDLTVRMAQMHAPYYKNIPTEGICWSLERLSEITPIRKSDLYEHQKEILSAITTFGFVSFTTGTTNQPPLLIERSQEEQLYLQNFFNLLQSKAHEIDPKPLGIAEGSMNHGSVLRLPGVGYSFMIELTKDYGIIRTAWLLQNEFHFKGYESKVSHLQTTVMGLCYLHQYLVENNIEIPKGQLNNITVFGWPIPKSRRKKMESFFGISINDNYSMSEMFGGARYCHDCDGYHFDPFVVPELIDLNTGETLSEGTGELLLTPLFPFTQRFVLLRYRTGDLVDVVKTNCPKGSLAYRFRGRLKRCLKIEDSTYLGEAEMAKAIDEIEAINRADTHFRIFEDNNKNNWPLFKMKLDKGNLILRFELAFDPETDPSKTEAVKKRIQKKIDEELPDSITSWMHQNSEKIIFQFIPPNTLEGRDYWNL